MEIDELRQQEFQRAEQEFQQKEKALQQVEVEQQRYQDLLARLQEKGINPDSF